MSEIPTRAVKEPDLLIRLRAFHFNNAEEGRGGATRTVFASDLRKANALISEAALALSAAYTRGQMDMWQPIETAPKDGRRVLCWNKEWQAPESGCLYGTKWASNGLAADKGGWKYQPTHWCPLPSPPAIRSLPLQDEEGK